MFFWPVHCGYDPTFLVDLTRQVTTHRLSWGLSYLCHSLEGVLLWHWFFLSFCFSFLYLFSNKNITEERKTCLNFVFLLQGVKNCFRSVFQLCVGMYMCECGAAYDWLCAVKAPWRDNADEFRLGSVWECLDSSLISRCHVLRAPGNRIRAVNDPLPNETHIGQISTYW